MLNADPSLLVSHTTFSSIEFTGIFYVATKKDDDYIGFVFNYQSNRRFILVSWKQKTQTYGRSGPEGKAGLQIHVVNSKTGPSRSLIKALWYSGTTADQVRYKPHLLHLSGQATLISSLVAQTAWQRLKHVNITSNMCQTTMSTFIYCILVWFPCC